MKRFLLGVFLSSTFFVFAQKDNDSIYYTIHKKRLIASLETGFNSSPLWFNLNYGNHKKIEFIPNTPLVIKPSISYYGATLSIGFKLPVNILSTNSFTKTHYFDLGLNFTIKRFYFAVNFQHYDGFTLINQGSFDTTGVIRSNNGIYSNLATNTAEVNMRYFFNKNFNYKAALGILGDYKKSIFSPYIYSYLGAYGVNNGDNMILPSSLQNPKITSSQAQSINAFEFGVIPGVAGVLRKGWFQGNMVVGFGPLIQAKSFVAPTITRGFLGLNTRTDLQISFGIQKDKWFLLANAEFRYKRINIDEVKFQEIYYDFRIIGGYRFRIKTPQSILKFEQKRAEKKAKKRSK